LQLGFYFALLWSGSVLFQCGQMLADVHPLSRAVPPAGGFTEATRSDKLAFIQAGLAVSTDARAPELRHQLNQRAPYGYMKYAMRQFPVRHQASNQDDLRWLDDKHHVEWTFSHDAMRFHGRDIHTSKDRGWLGLGGLDDSRPFPAVPVLSNPYIMTPQQLYARDDETQQVHQLIELKAPETLAGPPMLIGKRWYVLTNLRVIAYDPPVQFAAKSMLKEQFSAALPGPFNDFDGVVIKELPLGVVLSFKYGRNMVEGQSGSIQTVVLVDASGAPQVVARRALTHDFPLLFEHRDWWLSPLLHTVLAAPDLLLDKGMILDRGQSSYSIQLERSRPPTVVIAAVLAALLSAGAAAIWLRGVRIGPRRKAGWIAACLLVGPPACLSLMLLQPRPVRRARGLSRASPGSATPGTLVRT
jgi:hypothetical protein